MRRGLCVLITFWLAGACGPKRIDPAIEAARLAAEARARAELRVSEGCYDCLLEARATYERLAIGTNRAPLLVPLFEVELLLTLREKELAIDHAASLARAKAIARELPPTAEAGRYLAIVEAVPPDLTGVAVFKDINWRSMQLSFVPRIDDELTWLANGGALQLPVRQYLALSLDCSYAGRRTPPGQTTRQSLAERTPLDVTPLVSYRTGICDARQAKRLEDVRAANPRFAEAAYYMGRTQLGRAQETGSPGARQLLSEAYARFPSSRSVAYMSGNFEQLIGDCKAALRFYDETLALEPEHDNALLGRTVCLAFLQRFDEAIAAATHLIALKPTTLGYGFYWRAWVQHHLGRLDPARADIEQAKATTRANDILRLAGIIEYDQGQLDIAETDLVAAKLMMGGRNDCIARWYLGLVQMKRERWSDSGIHFEDAMLCYEGNVIIAEDGLKKMQAAENVDPDFKARQIAGFEAVIKEATSQQYASAFNAANHFARAGDLSRARRLVDIAGKDPALASLVADLRKIIGGFWHNDRSNAYLRTLRDHTRQFHR